MLSYLAGNLTRHDVSKELAPSELRDMLQLPIYQKTTVLDIKAVDPSNH
jgi:hypothetical protein